METSDISDSMLFRKCGLRGAKIFARLWFPFLYFLLVAVNAGASVLFPKMATSRGDRILLGCVVGGLRVLAASVLTRMCLEFLAEVKELERRGRPE
jgi:uncharacterized membrane protein YdjX (TVP38/TMEM64 family)